MQRQIAFSFALAIGVIVFGIAAPLSAQVGGQGRAGGGHAAAGHPPAGHAGAPHGGTADSQEAVEPAEPEEGPPEKKYDSLPVDPKLKREASKISAILHDGKFPDAETGVVFTNFYNNYFLSRWSKQEDAKDLVKYRGELSSHFRTAKTDEEARDYLTRLALDFLKRLVVGNFHPAVRINAMLAIGEINSVERNGTTPAVPLPEALDVMIAALNSSDSGKFPAGVRAAALVGIQRHAWAHILGSDAQKKVNDAMLRLAVADVPAGSTPSAHAWMAAQAVEILGALGAVGENNEAFTAMLKLVADAKLPFLVRCAAADAMGRLKYSSTVIRKADTKAKSNDLSDSAGSDVSVEVPVLGVDPVETAAALGRLAIDSCNDGLAPPKDLAGAGKKWPATMEYTNTAAFRRRMVYRLDAVLLALGGIEDDKSHRGIASLAKEKDSPPQAFIAALQKAIKEAVDELDHKTDPHTDLAKDPNVKLDDMKDTVAKLQSNLEQLLQKKP